MEKIEKAKNIAIRALRKCYSNKGIYAGRRNYDDYWARDSFFSCLGANKLKDFCIVKKNLELFLNYMKKNGQLPLRVGQYNLILKFLGFKKKELNPRFVDDKAKSLTTDQNSLFIIAAFNYVKKSRDIGFATRHFNKFEKITGWNLTQDFDKDSLMEERCYANWADGIKKTGKVLYTNVCHYKALTDMASLCKILKKRKKQAYYSRLANTVKLKINDDFWNNNYYCDWINKEKQNYFSTDGNVLAILWGIADRKKSRSIQTYIERFKINKIPSMTNWPHYPFWLASYLLRILGIADYHNGMRWLWLGCMDVLAKQKIGMKKEAKMLLGKIADKIIQYNNVYEVYESNGKPVSRLLYKSEVPFAWSAGLFILAAEGLSKTTNQRLK